MNVLLWQTLSKKRLHLPISHMTTTNFQGDDCQVWKCIKCHVDNITLWPQFYQIQTSLFLLWYWSKTLPQTLMSALTKQFLQICCRCKDFSLSLNHNQDMEKFKLLAQNDTFGFLKNMRKSVNPFGRNHTSTKYFISALTHFSQKKSYQWIGNLFHTFTENVATWPPCQFCVLSLNFIKFAHTDPG